MIASDCVRRAALVGEHRHQALRIEREVRFAALLAPPQVDRRVLVGQALEVEGDAHAVGG